MDITLTVDEKQTSQLVYSKDLDVFLQITTIPQAEIDNQVSDWQSKLDEAQARIDSFTPLKAIRQTALDEKAQQALPPDQVKPG